MFNRTRNNIENKLSTISLDIYVDDLINQYVLNEKYPTLEYLLKSRLINEIIINPEIVTDAYLKKKDDYFSLTLKRQLDTTKPIDRFLLAHEIAHTFLYEIKSNRIFDNFTFTKSSLEQEYFCNFFARALLIPKKEVELDFTNRKGKLSLKIFNELTQKYNVPYNEFLKRVLNDLEILKNVVIIRFAKFPSQPNWKLFENYMSETIRYNKEYFIPTNNYKTDVKYFDRFPTCDKLLSTFLSENYNLLSFDTEKKIKDIENILKGKPLSHFSRNLTKDTQFLLSKSRSSKYHTDIINLMIVVK